ncbi:unnamed protein product, partial [Nesidiocoris tenuis]
APVRDRFSGVFRAPPRQSGRHNFGRVRLRQDRIDQIGDAVFGSRQPVAVQSDHRTDPGSFAVARELWKREDVEERQFVPVRQIPRGPLQRV